MRHRPFFWCVVWFVAGTLLAARAGTDSSWITLLGVCLAGLLAAGPVRPARWPAVAAACLAAGGLLARSVEARQLVPDHIGLLVASPIPRTVLVQGVVEPDTRCFGDVRAQAALRVESVRMDGRWYPYTGRAWWSWYQPTRRPVPGERVLVRGRIRQARGFRNPGLFDYGAYLRSRGFHSQLTSAGADDVVFLGAGTLPPRQAALAWVRRAVHAAADRIPASAAARGFLLAVVAGDRSELAPEVREAAMRTGTYHLLSISGLHVGIVAACAFALMRAIGLKRQYVPPVATVLLVGYALGTGAAVPVVRATIMCVCALWCLNARRPPDSLSVLSLAAAAVVVLDPLAFRSAGCQLSFCAVAVLITIYPGLARGVWDVLERVMPRRGRYPAWILVHSLLVPLVVQISVAPLLLWHFHRAPLLGIVANTVATPLLSAVLVTGVAAVTLQSIAPAWAGPISYVAAWAAEVLVGWMRWVAGVGDLLTVPPLPLSPGILAVTLAMMWAAWQLFRRRPALQLGGALACLACIFIWPGGTPPRGVLEIIALDVGRADASVVRFPTGEVMLIDGGSRSRTFDAGELVVAPYLLRHGIRHVDWVVATHWQNDHIGGLISTLRLLSVGEVLTNGGSYDTWTARTFRAICRERGIPLRRVARGERWRIGPVCVSALNPPRARYADTGNDENNNSIALRLDYGGTAVLFPADASESLSDIVHAGAPWPERVVVKAPHHGWPRPGTSRAVARLQPLVAWASLAPQRGRADRLEGLRGAQSAWRTDWHGAIRIRITEEGAVHVEPTVGEVQAFPPSMPSEGPLLAGVGNGDL